MNQHKSDPARPRQRQAAAQSKTLPEKLSAQPAPDDRKGWKAHWETQQQPWRTEPVIDAARQQELVKCYEVTPDVEKGIYPFQGMKLSRADVEWLLSTYKDSFTPKKGLDVRGADLNEVDLRGMPLIGLRGGLTLSEWGPASEEQRKTAAVQMNKTLLDEAQLQGAHLSTAQLQGADLCEARLQGARLFGAQLQGANLSAARLQGAYLSEAQFQGARLYGAQLQGTLLNRTQLQGVNLLMSTLANPQGVGPFLLDVRWDSANLTAVDWSQIKILENEYTARKKNRQGKGSVGVAASQRASSEARNA